MNNLLRGVALLVPFLPHALRTCAAGVDERLNAAPGADDIRLWSLAFLLLLVLSSGPLGADDFDRAHGGASALLLLPEAYSPVLPGEDVHLLLLHPPRAKMTHNERVPQARPLFLRAHNLPVVKLSAHRVVPSARFPRRLICLFPTDRSISFEREPRSTYG